MTFVMEGQKARGQVSTSLILHVILQKAGATL